MNVTFFARQKPLFESQAMNEKLRASSLMLRKIAHFVKKRQTQKLLLFQFKKTFKHLIL